jgi:hypothetical protein
MSRPVHRSLHLDLSTDLTTSPCPPTSSHGGTLISCPDRSPPAPPPPSPSPSPPPPHDLLRWRGEQSSNPRKPLPEEERGSVERCATREGRGARTLGTAGTGDGIGGEVRTPLERGG